MRISLVGPVHPYRGGIAHYTTLLDRSLRARQHDVLLISFKRQYPRWLYPGRSDRDPSARPLVAEDARFWIDSLNPATWLITAWRICRYRPDVLVLQWWTVFWSPAWLVLTGLVRGFTRARIVIICHNVVPHDAPRWQAWLARLILPQAHELIVQSQEEERRLHELLPSAHSRVVPHPVYDMFAPDKMPLEEARRLLSLPANATVLLFFGHVRKYKGLSLVLDALPLIRAKWPDALLLVAGEFWEDKQPYENQIAELGLGEAVVMENRYIPNEEVARYFCAANVLVAPYVKVTGSGVMQMGAGFGLPIASTTDLAGGSHEPGAMAGGQAAERFAEAVIEALREPAAGRATAGARSDGAAGWQALVAGIEGGSA
jgi:glycosyltransferase involved in cell wall biosynthesis